MKESRSIQALQTAIEKGEERIKIMDADIVRIETDLLKWATSGESIGNAYRAILQEKLTN
jgi:hypothetical protein